MNRLLVLGGIASAAILAFAFARPAAPPTLTVAANPPPRAHRFQKGHPFASPVCVVYVVGAVARPGLYRVAEGSRIDDAVKAAGGLLNAADPASIDLAEHVADGEEIDVLRAGERTTARLRSHATRSAHARKRRRTRAAPSAPVDVNTADAGQLASLPGIGSILAERIVEFRSLNGPFASVDELADVAGMTQRRLDALAPYLRTTSQ
ncbi:MAG TPA: ComEA family DNA-binding protein [Candidatus Baltobacteraceae bacterium]|jgi:competence protein ComEA|nr:ComEA family DNA-binding protein [Candidatus Baltobacteraceae bacterium]